MKSIFFIAVACLMGCGQSLQSKDAARNEKTLASEQALTIDTFSTFPPEFEGCACYFSNDSVEFLKGAYIYLNDFAQTSYLKVNGKPEMFTHTNNTVINKNTSVTTAKNDSYEISIEVVQGKPVGDESFIETGTIKLSDKNGRTITKTFYGECGC